MPTGSLILIIAIAAVYFGVAQRVIDKMYLTDKAAILFLLGMAVASFIEIPIYTGNPAVGINLGGIFPLGLAAYVFIKSDSGAEKLRSVLAIAITASALYLLNVFSSRLREPGMDLLYLNGLVAGLISYLISRSRRMAFICATLSVFLLDVIHFIYVYRTGLEQPISIGGAGYFDSIVVAGLTAVLVAELIGETIERLRGGHKDDN